LGPWGFVWRGEAYQSTPVATGLNPPELPISDEARNNTHIQGSKIFFVADGQNPDKKWPKWLFFEKVIANIAKCFNYGNFHIHRCLKLFGRLYIFCRKNVVLPKKQVFTLIQQFLRKLKITCYNLLLFILIKLRTIH